MLVRASIQQLRGRELQPHEIVKLKGPDGRISIAGFGSLLSKRSALSTFPELTGFRTAYLPNMRRFFAHKCPIFYIRGIAKRETKEESSMCVEPCDNVDKMLVTVFEVPATDKDIESFVEREHEFRFIAVEPTDENGKGSGRLAVICSKYTDEEYKAVRCKGDPAEFERRFGQHGVTQVWDNDDILPCRVYLRHCVLAAQSLGEEAYNNFLDTSFLGDRKTTIRQHLINDPSIMLEQPPESLRERYSG